MHKAASSSGAFMKVGKVTKKTNIHSCKEVLLLTSRETALKNRKGISQVKQPCLPTHTSLASATRLSGVSSHHRPLSTVALLRVHQNQVPLTQFEMPRQGWASGASLYVAFYLGKISVGSIAYRILCGLLPYLPYRSLWAHRHRYEP